MNKHHTHTTCLQLNVSSMFPSSKSRLHLNSMKKYTEHGSFKRERNYRLEGKLEVIKRQKKKEKILLSVKMDGLVPMVNTTLLKTKQKKKQKNTRTKKNPPDLPEMAFNTKYHSILRYISLI